MHAIVLLQSHAYRFIGKVLQVYMSMYVNDCSCSVWENLKYLHKNNKILKVLAENETVGAAVVFHLQNVY